MSIQRIDNPRGRTYGYQARVHKPGGGRLTRFCSDGSNGGHKGALKRAEQAEKDLQAELRRMKRRGQV